jgi:hypothetical protein
LAFVDENRTNRNLTGLRGAVRFINCVLHECQICFHFVPRE